MISDYEFDINEQLAEAEDGELVYTRTADVLHFEEKQFPKLPESEPLTPDEILDIKPFLEILDEHCPLPVPEPEPEPEPEVKINQFSPVPNTSTVTPHASFAGSKSVYSFDNYGRFNVPASFVDIRKRSAGPDTESAPAKRFKAVSSNKSHRKDKLAGKPIVPRMKKVERAKYTREEIKEIRREKNRLSAAESRKQKRDLITSLEQKVTELLQKNEILESKLSTTNKKILDVNNQIDSFAPQNQQSIIKPKVTEQNQMFSHYLSNWSIKASVTKNTPVKKSYSDDGAARRVTRSSKAKF